MFSHFIDNNLALTVTRKNTNSDAQTSLCDHLVLWLYSPGHNRTGAAVGPVEVRAEGDGSPRTAVPDPVGSWDTVLGHSGRDLK